ncbi:MAG TPA: hypothetical protein VMF55_15925 [Solirubrobacterales bacterium]|nr:hypothetical protein [Solirubrobacterales bacterium]
MSRRLAYLFVLSVAVLLMSASPAFAAFGFKELDVSFETEEGTSATEAGSHPYAMKTTIFFNTAPDQKLKEALEESLKGEAFPGFEAPDGEIRGLTGLQVMGLVARPGALETCPTADFFGSAGGAACPEASQVGVSSTIDEFPPTPDPEPLYALTPPPGVLLRLGFKATSAVPIVIDVGLTEKAPYRGVVSLVDAPNVVPVYGSEVTLWGVPGDKGHNAERTGSGSVSNENPKPFLTLPRACTGPLDSTYSIESWEGATAERTVSTHGDSVPPEPLGMGGCEGLSFGPRTAAAATSHASGSSSGLGFELLVPDEGIESAEGRASSDVRKTVVTLPEGFAINPSQAEGLVACSEADLAQETSTSQPGEGCPNASKIGTVEVETPLLEEKLGGSIYVATPFKNPEHSLIGLYMVIKNARYGLSIAIPLKVEADPQTGRLTATGDELPQLPFSHFTLRFREGPRAPLTTPSSCGSYQASAVLTPWSGGASVTSNSTFEVTTGPEGGGCPAGGTPAFSPQMEAGTINPAGGASSPFVLKLTRSAGQAPLRTLETTLPEGLLASLAGVQQCSDAQIAAAAARSGPEEGAAELASPSCPAGSRIGTVRVGAGSGALTYVNGSAYLAGPYKGAPLSMAIVTPAISGPFDLGTVVVRVALQLDPVTTQVKAVSDALPTILQGIPLDIRSVYVNLDRQGFTRNPTSCEPSAVTGTAGSAFGQSASLSTRFQVGGCASLPFQPKLALQLKGGVKRTSHPRVIATLTAKEGEANIARAQVKLPAAVFLDQGHIKTVCTRVQWAADTCPGGSVYGKVEATTPLLSYPLTGSVYLRSSSHKLPDLVAKLRGPASQPIEIELDGKTDSVKGALRNTFEAVPDAPVSKFRLELFGGKRGLVEMSSGFCGNRNATVKLAGQNGAVHDTTPAVAAKCPKPKKGVKKGGHGK